MEIEESGMFEENHTETYNLTNKPLSTIIGFFIGVAQCLAWEELLLEVEQ